MWTRLDAHAAECPIFAVGIEDNLTTFPDIVPAGAYGIGRTGIHTGLTIPALADM
jgi:hypothetical protein